MRSKESIVSFDIPFDIMRSKDSNDNEVCGAHIFKNIYVMYNHFTLNLKTTKDKKALFFSCTVYFTQTNFSYHPTTVKRRLPPSPQFSLPHFSVCFFGFLASTTAEVFQPLKIKLFFFNEINPKLPQ